MALPAGPSDPPGHAVAVVRLWREPDGALRVRLLWRADSGAAVARTFDHPDAAIAALAADVAAWTQRRP